MGDIGCHVLAFGVPDGQVSQLSFSQRVGRTSQSSFG